ncbi:MAG: HEAT repeat domain-containing protein, partial [Candidatus Thorarchaeota archaeon]
SRIDVLGTFYGFTILMIEGSKPIDIPSDQRYRYRYRRSWLDEKLSQNVVDVVKQLTGEFGDAVDMDVSYKTLGSSRIFKKRCTKTTAEILADAVRLTMYKVPGNRGTAARKLGLTEDSRVLPFLHARFNAETNRNTRIRIAHALGSVGHESSIDILKERAILRGRYLSKESMATVSALGRIFSPRCRETLIELVRDGGTSVKAAAVQALSLQEPSGLIELIYPYLKNPSKPVVRSTVLALMNLGREGQAVIKDQAHSIITKLGSDKTSRPVLNKLFTISTIGEMPLVQEYFSERIKKLSEKVKKIKDGTNRRFSPYYYRRRENRATRNLTDAIRMSASYLKPPFLDTLITNLQAIWRIEDLSHIVVQSLRSTQLAEALKEKPNTVKYEQLYV